MKRAVCAASVALALCLPAPAFAAEVIDVLWYAYSPEGAESRYRERMRSIGAQVPRLTNGKVSWRITFFGPGERPNFRAYDVLVTESSFYYIFDSSDFPDYSGLFNNETAIVAARGNRTVMSNASGLENEATSTTVQDSQVGLLMNWINWAGSGTGLGIVALDDEDGHWKREQRSFLRFDADPSTDFYFDAGGGDRTIPAYARNWPINRGISERTIGDVGESTSVFKLPEPEGYVAIAHTLNVPPPEGPWAVTVITRSQAAGDTTPPPSMTCRARGGLLAQPITLSARSRPRIPVRMRLVDGEGETVEQGDLRASPLLAVQHGYRTQIVGPFTWCPRTRTWKTTVPSTYFNERGVHHVEVHPGDGSYDVEMCAQTVTRR